MHVCVDIREAGQQYPMICYPRPTPYCHAYHAVCLHPTLLIGGGPGPCAAQETGGEGYEATDAATTTEVAQGLPRIRTSRDDERLGGGAANGPTDAKVMHSVNNHRLWRTC